MTRKEHLERWRSLALSLLDQKKPALAVSILAIELPKWKGPGAPHEFNHEQAMADAVFGRLENVREWIENLGREEPETMEVTGVDRRRLALIERVSQDPQGVASWSDDELDRALSLLGFDRDTLRHRLYYGRKSP